MAPMESRSLSVGLLCLLLPAFLLSTLVTALPLSDLSLPESASWKGQNLKRLPWSAADHQIEFTARDVQSPASEHDSAKAKREVDWYAVGKGSTAPSIASVKRDVDTEWIGVDSVDDSSSTSTRRNVAPTWIGVDSVGDDSTSTATARSVDPAWIGVDSVDDDSTSTAAKRNLNDRWIGVDTVGDDDSTSTTSKRDIGAK